MINTWLTRALGIHSVRLTPIGRLLVKSLTFFVNIAVLLVVLASAFLVVERLHWMPDVHKTCHTTQSGPACGYSITWGK